MKGQIVEIPKEILAPLSLAGTALKLVNSI